MMKSIYTVILFMLVLSGVALGQSKLAQINDAFANDTVKSLNGSAVFSFWGKDTLLLAKNECSIFIPLKDISAIGFRLAYNLHPSISFYTKSNKEIIASKFQDELSYSNRLILMLGNKVRVMYIRSLFFDLYKELQLNIPDEPNTWMLNDKSYEKWAIKSKVNSNGDCYRALAMIDTLVSGYNELRYPNDKIRCERNTVNGICHGLQKDYYENGQLESTTNYINGLESGTSIVYNEKGLLVYRAQFYEGVENGLVESWFDNGEKASEGLYDDGKIIHEKYWQGGVETFSDFSDNEDFYCSDYTANEILAHHVKEFKDTVSMSLIIDSVQFFDKTYKVSTSYNLKIGKKSSLLKISDSLYIKIILIRDNKYGMNIYAWNWEYYQKNERCVGIIGSGCSEILSYNSPNNIGNGQGLGYPGTPQYFIIYRRYKIFDEGCCTKTQGILTNWNNNKSCRAEWRRRNRRSHQGGASPVIFL